MVIYYPTFEIPLLFCCIGLWIFCCHLAKKSREVEGDRLRSNSNTPSVYIIPIYTEDLEDEEQEDEMDINEAYSQSYRHPPVYAVRNVSPPPPYMLEPPSYRDPPPSYTDPPAYSERP